MRRAILTLLLFGTAAGCQDPIMQIDQSVDCRDVCDRYRSCFDSNYDTAACRTRCENYVHGDGGHGSAADACDMCMDDTSCASAAFTCNSACVNILP